MVARSYWPSLVYYYLLIILVPANKVENIEYFSTLLGLIFIEITRGPLQLEGKFFLKNFEVKLAAGASKFRPKTDIAIVIQATFKHTVVRNEPAKYHKF